MKVRRPLQCGLVAFAAAILSAGAAHAAAKCPDAQAKPQAPSDVALCATLEAAVRNPSASPPGAYQAKLARYLGAMCHRNESAGWVRDKRVRDTGPWIGSYRQRKWTGKYYGTHLPAIVWYSPEMHAWLKANRAEHGPAPANAAPVPDGAMMVKEMYSPPAAGCAGVDPAYLLPGKHGAAVMVRDSRGSYDGWFWGWYGYPGSGWSPDWPAKASSPYPNMGFGQYCTNCHSSAKDQTFAALKNMQGEPGEPLVFLSQNFFLDPSWEGLHSRIQKAGARDAAALGHDPGYDEAFLRVFWSLGGLPARDQIADMPPETYDRVWAKPGEPSAAAQFLTSDQCLGCHSAGGTGLHYDMTEPGPDGKLLNISPYGTWRGSPMGLSGRDPIFFAQLASETQTFHPQSKAFIEDACLGCHGVLGQRQHAIDAKAKSGACAPFARAALNAIPWSENEDDPVSALAHYGALARDGVSCMACHQMVLGKSETDRHRDQPQNACVEDKQKLFNPGLTGFAATFTGAFFLGPPGELFGPFESPKTKPMKHATGVEPKHSKTMESSERCGSCHTVHLPVIHRGKTIGRAYEQTTYPEWAFSAYRTGDFPDGALPYGAGREAKSCQGCHMPEKDAAGNAYRSKIASIQEYSNFPQAEHTLPPQDLDLPERAGFSKHTLTGLNVLLQKMAWQFPDILGVRRSDPMLAGTGVDPIPGAEAAALELAANRTASVTVSGIRVEAGALAARVAVTSQVGHKFPSGVGFRRTFLQFSVLDDAGKVLWSSGRTDGAGVIVDEKGAPIAGELWWSKDCARRQDPQARIHQPHYQEITRQDQAQIYQELVAAPADVAAPVCGSAAKPEGPLTTSFLSICAKVKDNRILPRGFLALEERLGIAIAMGADAKLAKEAGPSAVGDDPDYRTGGGDALVYRAPLSEINGRPAAVQATLYYQPTPPFYLQDRFCTSDGPDAKRLFYVAGKLKLAGTPAQDWKLRLVTSGPVRIP